VEVCYPLLVEASTASFTYVWHSQAFPLASCPRRWRQAVKAALQAAGAAGSGREPGAPGPPTDGAAEAQAAASSGACSPRSLCAGELATPLPQACAASGALGSSAAAAGAAFPERSWWHEPCALLPAGEPLACEWAPAATYFYHAATGEAEAWLHQDQSVLRTSQGGRWGGLSCLQALGCLVVTCRPPALGPPWPVPGPGLGASCAQLACPAVRRFLQHLGLPGSQQRLYTADTVPQLAAGGAGGQAHDLHGIAAHLVRFRWALLPGTAAASRRRSGPAGQPVNRGAGWEGGGC
jgi:hypothetical protein